MAQSSPAANAPPRSGPTAPKSGVATPKSDAATPKSDAPQPAPRKKKTKLIAIACVVVLFSAAGAGGWLYWHKPHQEKRSAAKEEHKSAPVFVNLEPFTVNLQGDDGEHYLQTEIVIQVTGAEAVDEIKRQMPVLRSDILLALSSKSTSELSSLEGKKKLMQELIARTRKLLALPAPSRGIENVYFSSFVIQ